MSDVDRMADGQRAMIEMRTQRPTRVPPPTQTQYAEDRDHEIVVEPARANSVPATVGDPGHQPQPHRQAEPHPLPVTPFGNLAGAIAAVMAEIKPVEKGGWNKFQSYSYARIQDLMGTLTPLMGKHGIVVFQNEEGREMFDDGRAIAVRYRFTIVHKSGEIWPERILQTGLSSCRNTKDGFDDKSLNKCHTAARKYFLLSLFQIPTEDAEDSDAGPARSEGQQRQRPQGRPVVPSPTGKLPPHILPIVDGEKPLAWAARFAAFVAKAESSAEIDKWYEANVAVFDKLKTADSKVYNDSIDFMDACADKFNTKKNDPISSGLPASDFPADKPRNNGHVTERDIPINLDRRLSDSDREWITSLREAFEQCHTVGEIASENESMMLPAKEIASSHAWNIASALMDQHIERVQGKN